LSKRYSSVRLVKPDNVEISDMAGRVPTCPRDRCPKDVAIPDWSSQPNRRYLISS
jgi:hypothetical protein